VSEDPLGAAPAHFTPALRKIWDELSAMAPHLSCADRWLTEITCTLMRKSRAREPLQTGFRTALLKSLSRLGLTPADRANIVIPPRVKKNRFAGFNTIQ
jgi:hypothetical protein